MAVFGRTSGLRRLSLYLGANYLVGFQLGFLATGTFAGGVVGAFLAPGITVILIALAGLARS